MNERERKQVEERLLAERDRTVKALRRSEMEGNSDRGGAADVSRFPTHMADGGSLTEEEEKDYMLASMESERLTRIDQALELLYKDPGAFEKCEDCGSEIAVERFDIVPWTRLCSACAAAKEGAGGRP